MTIAAAAAALRSWPLRSKKKTALTGARLKLL